MSKLRWLPDSRTIKGGCSTYILVIIALVVILLSSCSLKAQMPTKYYTKVPSFHRPVIYDTVRLRLCDSVKILKGLRTGVICVDTVNRIYYYKDGKWYKVKSQ